MNRFSTALRRIFNNHAWVRPILPIAIVVVWLGVAGIGGPTFGKLSSVSTNDQASFLPSSAQSTKVQEVQAKFRDSSSIPAIVVFESTKTISPFIYADYVEIAKKT